VVIKGAQDQFSSMACLRCSSAHAAKKHKEQCFGPQSCIGIRCFLAGVPSSSLLAGECDQASDEKAEAAKEAKLVNHTHTGHIGKGTPSPRVRGHKEDIKNTPTTSQVLLKSKALQRSTSTTTAVVPVVASHPPHKKIVAALRRQVDSTGDLALEDSPASATWPSMMQVTFIFAGFFVFFLVTAFMFYEQIARMLNPIVAASWVSTSGYRSYEGATHEPMCRL